MTTYNKIEILETIVAAIISEIDRCRAEDVPNVMTLRRVRALAADGLRDVAMAADQPEDE